MTKQEAIAWMLMHGGVVSHAVGIRVMGAELFYGTLVREEYVVDGFGRGEGRSYVMGEDQDRGVAYEVTDKGKELLK